MNSTTDFHKELDALLLAGVSTQDIAERFRIRERGVRRRKGALLAQGFTFPAKAQGAQPETHDADDKH